MTVPREIYVEEIETNHLCGMYSNTEYSNFPHKYYSQAVIDEKDARIKQLEQGIKDMSVAHKMSHTNFCDEAYWRDEFDIIEEQALAGKGGSDERP